MTFEEKIALSILVLALIGLGTVITWALRLIKFLFIKIFCTYKITITRRDDAPKTKKQPAKQKHQYKTIPFPDSKAQDDFYKSAYYMAKRVQYTDVINNLGMYGEYLIYDYLKEYQNTGGRFLFNCYLPKGENKTTEIDVILIHPHGIFVFESKNYSGWIFGNDISDYWTQTLPIKRGKSHKERFYNPIKQNNLHIDCLRKIIGNHIPIISVIVFSERCTLKDIDVKTPNVYIINRNNLSMVVSGIMINNHEQLDIDEVNEIYQKLYPYTQVSEEVKKKHIADINRENAELPFL